VSRWRIGETRTKTTKGKTVMSLKTRAELNKAEQTGRTIARANARLITTEEANAVSGALLPSQATSCQCVWYKGVDYGGWDE
jgi:hypothetical protein